MVDNDGKGQNDPHHNRKLQGDEEGVSRRKIDETEIGIVRKGLPDGLDQKLEDTEVVDQKKSTHGPHDHSHEAPENPPPKLFQMIQKGHLPATLC